MKKLFSLLMAVVLVISLVPVLAASAAEPSCDHMGGFTYEPNGSTKHDVVCAECGEVTGTTDCVFTDGVCLACGNKAATSKPSCDHMGGFTYKPNGSTKHDVICAKCGEVTDTADCVFTDGVCLACGNKAATSKPSCDHMGGFTYKPNGSIKHDVICAKCGEVTDTAGCVFTDGVCLACGNKAATSQPECDHMGNHWEYTPVDKLNHSVKCTDCGKIVTASTPCVFTDGKCVCGNVAATSQPECDHMGNHWEYTPVDKLNHSVKCTDCGKIVTASTPCVFTDGKCVCGNVAATSQPTCDHMGNHWKYIPNGHLHHDVWCEDCDTLVTEKTPCVFTNGVCLACGNVAKTACDHVGVQDCIPLDATHHKVVCPKCGATVETCVDCVFESGVCACGNKKPVHGNTNDKDLDQVPKTGDVLAPVVVLSGLMSAAGFVTKKRFF